MLAGDFFFVEVGDGRAVVDPAEAVDGAGGEQHGGDQLCLAASAVADDGDIADGWRRRRPSYRVSLLARGRACVTASVARTGVSTAGPDVPAKGGTRIIVTVVTRRKTAARRRAESCGRSAESRNATIMSDTNSCWTKMYAIVTSPVFSPVECAAVRRISESDRRIEDGATTGPAAGVSSATDLIHTLMSQIQMQATSMS